MCYHNLKYILNIIYNILKIPISIISKRKKKEKEDGDGETSPFWEGKYYLIYWQNGEVKVCSLDSKF